MNSCTEKLDILFYNKQMNEKRKTKGNACILKPNMLDLHKEGMNNEQLHLKAGHAAPVRRKSEKGRY